MVTIPKSFKGITFDKAIILSVDLCQLSFKFGSDNNLEDLHKTLKQLINLYFDCKNARSAISDSLLALGFVPYAVKAMKRLNNLGVFKNDDIWFSTFYLYKICWNYSEGNKKFATSLVDADILILLVNNLTHNPYIDNILRKNVNCLLKSTLSIIHNIIRLPGCRYRFCDEKLIGALTSLSKSGDLMGMLSVICLGFIRCNENVASTIDLEPSHNVKLLLSYVDSAIVSGTNKAESVTMFELLQVLHASTLCQLHQETIRSVADIQSLIEYLQRTMNEREKIELLSILANIANDKDSRSRVCELANVYIGETSLLANTAKNVIWKCSPIGEDVTVASAGNAVFVCFADNDKEKAAAIFAKMEHCGKKVSLQQHENDCETLVKCCEQANIVVLCVSESMKGSDNFMWAKEHCLIATNKVIFPVLVDENYRVEGWLKDFVRATSDVCYHWSRLATNENEWQSFMGAIGTQVVEGPNNEEEREEEEEAMVVGEKGHIEGSIAHWLAQHGLAHLQDKLASLTMAMLSTLKSVRRDAPDYYYNALERHFSLSLSELLLFNAALDLL